MMFRNLLGLFVLTLVVFAIGTTLFISILEPYYIPVFPYLLGFFFIVNAAVLYFKIKAFNGRPESFPRMLMGINGARIFSYLLFLIVYLFFYKETSTYFLIGFLSCYLIYFIYDLAMSQKFK